MSPRELEVRLEDIPTCFEGIIPSPICTVAPDGTPNVTFLSVVHRVDSDHVALSRQFFNKTDSNTIANPQAAILLFEPETGRMFECDLVYERTESEGPLFERMRTNLDAVAEFSGLSDVFKLKGTDICRVESCALLPGSRGLAPPRRELKIDRVEDFSKRIAGVGDMDELFATLLNACEDLFGYPHAFVMLLDESGERLYTVASTGFASSGAGSEVRVGDGPIGIAAARRQSVRITHMSRERSYSQAARESANVASHDGLEQVIPLPSLRDIESQLVTPMLAYHQLVGVLCLQSDVPGAFQASDECVASILSSQVAMALAALPREEAGRVEASVPTTAAVRAVQVKHYQEDDSVFLDNEYLIKGVAGGILWRLLRNFKDEGRSEFSNREIRLDQTLELPDIKDNLEARLILLRKRLEERCDYLRIERVARGRFRIEVGRPLELVQVEGGGPF
jgi:hypothetical protein